MRKISSGNSDVNNRLSSHFYKPLAMAHHIKNPKGRPILCQNSPHLDKDAPIKEGPSSKEVLLNM